MWPRLLRGGGTGPRLGRILPNGREGRRTGTGLRLGRIFPKCKYHIWLSYRVDKQLFVLTVYLAVDDRVTTCVTAIDQQWKTLSKTLPNTVMVRRP